MKIAFIGQKIVPAKIDGTQKYVEEVSLCMAKMGHDVFVYGNRKNISKKILANKKIKIVFLPKLGELIEAFLASVHALFASYDVIHYQGEKSFFLSKLITTFSAKARKRGDQF